MFNLLPMLYVFLATAAGGLVQTTTGFGIGIVVMLIYPAFLPLLQSAALSAIVGLAHNLVLVIEHRKSIRYRAVWTPAVFYTLVSVLCIQLAKGMDMAGLKAYFGLFLLALAVYFMFFAKKLQIQANTGTALLCSGISGAAGGFFGIGGPPMVPYFISIVGDDKLAYLATIQLFFALTNCAGVITRAVSGIITAQVLLYTLPGVLGLLLGTFAGMKIIHKINAGQMKKIIYIFLAAAGLLTFVTNIR